MESKEIITNALDRRNLSMTDLVKYPCHVKLKLMRDFTLSKFR